MNQFVAAAILGGAACGVLMTIIWKGVCDKFEASANEALQRALEAEAERDIAQGLYKRVVDRAGELQKLIATAHLDPGQFTKRLSYTYRALDDEQMSYESISEWSERARKIALEQFLSKIESEPVIES